MATKVKGGAIKEGSIPLSALSEEIKNKIESAGGSNATPDWNAKEDEEGYIKNKTHYTTQIPLSTKVDTYIEDFPKYYDPDTERYYSKQDVDILYTEEGRDYLLTIPANTLLGYEDRTDAVNIEINEVGEKFQFESHSDMGDIFIKVTKPNYGDNFRAILYTQLNERFIPETIARKSNIATINGKSITNGGNIEIESGSSVTPNWDAQEGEAGYIENRTHCVITKDISVQLVTIIDERYGYDDEPALKIDNFISGYKLVFNNGWSHADIDFHKLGNYDISFNDEYFGHLYVGDDNYDNGIAITGDFVTAYENGEIDFINSIKMQKIEQLDEKYIPDTIARKSDLENLPSGSTKSKFQLYQENGGIFFTDENVYNIFDALRNEHLDYCWDLEIRQPLESGNTYTFDDLDLTYWNFIGVVYGNRNATVYINNDDAITLYNPGELTDRYLWFESDIAQLNIDLVAKTVEFNTWE